MSENMEDKPQEIQAPAEKASARATASRFNLGLAVAVVALVLIGWQWLDSRQYGNALEQNLGRRLADLDSHNKESQIVAARAQEESRQALVKVGIGQAARYVAQSAIQMHGGIGMTEEYAVGHYFRRCMVIERLWGDPAYYLQKLAQEVE